MPYQMEIRATSLWSKRKKKPQINIHVRLACPTNAHFKQWCPLFKIQKTIYKINFALTFLGSGKIRLQNEPRSRISGLGEK